MSANKKLWNVGYTNDDGVYQEVMSVDINEEGKAELNIGVNKIIEDEPISGGTSPELQEKIDELDARITDLEDPKSDQDISQWTAILWMAGESTDTQIPATINCSLSTELAYMFNHDYYSWQVTYDLNTNTANIDRGSWYFILPDKFLKILNDYSTGKLNDNALFEQLKDKSIWLSEVDFIPTDDSSFGTAKYTPLQIIPTFKKLEKRTNNDEPELLLMYKANVLHGETAEFLLLVRGNYNSSANTVEYKFSFKYGTTILHSDSGFELLPPEELEELPNM